MARLGHTGVRIGVAIFGKQDVGRKKWLVELVAQAPLIFDL